MESSKDRKKVQRALYHQNFKKAHPKATGKGYQPSTKKAAR